MDESGEKSTRNESILPFLLCCDEPEW